MTEGTTTYNGLGVPLYGESEIKQQTAATDLVTLTGAASISGDFLVCQNSTGAELMVVNCRGGIDFAIGSTTSTNYGISWTIGASGVVDALMKYTAGITGATTSVFQVSSSNGPSYLLSIASSAGANTGAAQANGFFEINKKFTTLSTASPIAAIKVLGGSYVFYIPCFPNTLIS